MTQQFTAIYKKRGRWYIGWVEEIPGVNSQGHTIKELKENLKEALELIIETNRFMTQKEIGQRFTREPLIVSLVK